MPIYWPNGNRTDAGLRALWPFLVAPLYGQNAGYLPAVLLALLESPPQGSGAAAGKTTGAPQGAWPAPAHPGPRAANGCRCDSFLARVPEEARLPDHAERPKLRLCRAAARVRRRNQRYRKAERVTGAAKIGAPAEGSRGFDDRQRVTMKIGTVNKESRAKSARHRRVLKMQSLGSGISPIAMDLVVCFANAKPRFRIGGLLPGQRHPVQESPPHGFQPLQEGLCRLLSEPTPSPRLCISAQGATPQRTQPDYHALAEGSTKTGTFYFAGNRNFLLCLDTAHSILNNTHSRPHSHPLCHLEGGPHFRSTANA